MPKNNTCVLVTGANELEDISGSVYLESGSVISSIVNNQSSNDIILSKNATKYPNISLHLTHIDEAQTDLQNNLPQNKNENVVNNKNTANASNPTALDLNKLQPGVIVNKILGKVVNILFKKGKIIINYCSFVFLSSKDRSLVAILSIHGKYHSSKSK